MNQKIMKNLALLRLVLVLSACGVRYDADSMPSAPVPDSDAAVMQQNKDDRLQVPVLIDDGGMIASEPSVQKTSSGNEIRFDNLTDRSVLESPVSISGQAPRRWFFEGSFPVTIMTLEEEVVHEWYAEGPWLEPLNGRGLEDLRADDMIPFTVTTEYEPPLDGDMGKVRFAKNLVADEDTPDMVEIMVLWP